MEEISLEKKAKLFMGLRIALIAFLIAVGVGLLIETIRNENNKQENTISFTGHGEVNAVPDLANVYFTISKDAKTAKEAQTLVAQDEKKALDSLKANNVLEKDIKTTNASFYPKYEYKYEKVICTEYGCPPNRGKNIIVGYTASETITVKIRNTDDVGKIVEELGAIGVSNLNGPNFSIDNEDGLKAEARKKAIDDAKAKALVLAKDLGIRLGGIVSFNESGDYPIMYATKNMVMEDSVGGASPVAQLPKGENTITSDVTITYKIK